MRISESQLRKIVRKAILEQVQPIPGDSVGPEQVHIFDFDDTLGVSLNPAGIMLMRNGKPAWQNPQDVGLWMSKNGILGSDVMQPGIVKINRLDGYAVYLTSKGLSKAQTRFPSSKRGVVFQETEPNAMNADEGLLIDFSPAAQVEINSTEAIGQTIQKMGNANSKGAETMVMTARKPVGDILNFEGEKVPVTNVQDITDFLSSQGTAPTLGVVGVTGQNKGHKIKNFFFNNDDPPEEIHFYDDAPINTDDVENELAEKVPAEVFIYGPGHFDRGEVNANKPTKSFPASENPEMKMERWLRLAGIIQE